MLQILISILHIIDSTNQSAFRLKNFTFQDQIAGTIENTSQWWINKNIILSALLRYLNMI
jgi:hypothetical protein